MSAPPALLTPAEAAAILARSPRTVLKLLARGTLHGRRLGPPSRGGRWLVDAASVWALKAAWDAQPPTPGRPSLAIPSAAAHAKRRSRANRAADDG